MNILILGATGPTGKILVEQALKQGHVVTALVRDKSKLGIEHEQLRVHEIDILDESALSGELLSQDVVLSALGTGRDLHSDFISRAMPVLISAMDKSKVRRLIFISSFGVGETRKQASFFSKFFFRLVLKDILADKLKADQLLRASDLDYTLVYPTRMTSGNKTGKYKAGTFIKISFSPTISRSDVVDFMLTEMKENHFVRQTAILSY
jgi:putative NADH-flavin reductase